MRGFVRHALSPARIRNLFGIVVLTVTLVPLGPAQAQLMDRLKGAMGSGENSGSAGGLPSVGQASPSNTAGLLQYCVKNNYVSGNGAASVKDSLMSKVTGSGNSANDSGFQAGNNGMLSTGNGQSYNLGGGGIKAQIAQKVCDQILQHAKSLL